MILNLLRWFLKCLYIKQNPGQLLFFVDLSNLNKKCSHFEAESIDFFGCGGKTRTYDLRVMSDG